jgi:aspartyl-tRNA(Asn)/glutamyl-tRNA(Gln) amidotransferase subunit C
MGKILGKVSRIIFFNICRGIHFMTIIHIDHQTVINTANLARLQIRQEDITAYTKDLNNILQLVSSLQTVELNNVTPNAHPLPTTLRLRPDVVTETNQQQKFLAIAPLTEAHLYLVPIVIE